MNRRQAYYLQQMGITVWQVRANEPSKADLSKLQNRVAACTRCELHQSRTQTVFSRGNEYASLMIIGEAPGFHEDKQGLPFVGKAGMLLDKMIASINLTQDDVYIANVIKCRPPNNRDPHADEIKACTDFLKEQIALVNPKLILAVGRFAGQYVLGSNLPLNKMRNQIHQYEGKPVIISYHPAYLLRNTKDKKKAFLDLMQVRQALNSLC